MSEKSKRSMWWDRAVVLGLAISAMVFTAGQSAGGDDCFNPWIFIDLLTGGHFLDLEQALDAGAPFYRGASVDVCFKYPDGYARVTYTLEQFAWVAQGPSSQYQLQQGPVPDDCIHSRGFQDEENPATGMVSPPLTMHPTNGIGPIFEASAAKPRAGAAAPVPEYPVGYDPAYVQELPFPPFFSPPAWQNVQLKCDPNQSYYTVNHGNGTVTHFGTCPLHKIVSIPVADSPLELALTPDASFLLVTSFSGPVSFIDTSTDQVAGTVSSPGAHPSGIAISPDGTRAYVTSFTTPGALLLIDVVNRKVTGSIPLPGYPRNVFVTPDGSQAWVNYLGSSQISIIDTLTNTAGFAFTLNAVSEAGIAFNPTGTRAYIATRAGTIAVIDTATLNSVANIPVGAWPVDVIVTPNGKRVLVDDFSPAGALVAIDAASNTVIGTQNTGAPITGLFFYPQVP